MLSDGELEEQVTKIIKEEGAQHGPDFLGPGEEKKTRDLSKLSKEHRQVEEILDRTVRPGLQADGGDLEVISFENNRIKISYQGACGDCPSSYMGTLEAIENILRYELQNDKIEIYPV